MALRVRIRIEGMRELLRAYDRLPDEAKLVVQEESYLLAQELAGAIQVAGQMRGRQAALAARTVRAEGGKRAPTITAGRIGGKKAKGVLFGTEFGATRKFGWYNRYMYYGMPNKQFPPHRGAHSYWFFKTIERNEARIGQQYASMLRRIAEGWGGAA